MRKAGFSVIVAIAMMFGAAPAAVAAGDQTAMFTPFQVDRVVVLKSERKLVLMSGDYVMRVYQVALGRYPAGHKKRQGDARTPEGEYTLDYKLENSAFHKAIRVSYPNSRDRARAIAAGEDPGGKIMIHGLPNKMTAKRVGHPAIDWTQGCIAVTNEEIEEIWKMVQIGTPIEIHP
tara:strand:+ start:209 stop:736 length:528 start_codon:yes stop_codon:yes gene_type:complete